MSDPRGVSTIDDSIAQAARVLGSASRVLVITGAGMSADSGMPTYRGVGGLYEEQSTADGVAIEEALSGPMFERDPALTWKYIAQIESACRGARPNAGHHAIVDLADHVEHLCVVTQNVDGLHRAAGTRELIEMHGNIHRLFCIRCGQSRTVPDYSRLMQWPPRCGRCNGLERPAVVLFEEMLPSSALERYQRELAGGFDVVLMIGTTAVFEYIAAPVRAAASGQGTAIEINPADTPVTALCDIKCPGPAADVVPAIVQQLETRGF
ncbi:NAD-dependent deacylase [Salinisphaera hydrothermalis]|uniref:protein acetyllysine N-acetyltransferase n=1 Tax=Salinisphaera hydrothermalis (strain C41B8) TaxID=1304275 RepID=A0A084IQ08_SALHC|nr:NAD-dependent deacylase [Salinisphaera hydrothermalis]KEZ78792.1 NAD-dependent deacetylase [Salinisphaera hydrothermalis C41B8]